MKAVIIGGTVSAMEAAIHLREGGYDVTLAVSSTFLGEDFTGTWKYFPTEKQPDGKARLSKLLPEYLSNEAEILLNGRLKKQFLHVMDSAGVSVFFMTRAAGVKSKNGRITHVLLADKLGSFFAPCDLLIDGTLHYELSHFLSGLPMLIKAGSCARLMLEYMDMTCLPGAPENGQWRCLRGAASEGHAYLIAEQTFQNDVSPEEARRQLVKTLIAASESIKRDPRCENAHLINTISPMLCAEIAPPSEKPYENLFLPDELLQTSPMPVLRSLPWRRIPSWKAASWRCS